MGGLLGAGLFGLIFGGGLFGGLGSITGLFGFVLQVALLFALVRLAMAFFANRPGTVAGPAAGGYPSGNLPGKSGATAGVPGPIAITAADFNAFEQLLIAIQSAYSAEDLSRLRQLATEQVVDFFGKGLAANAQRGIVNRLSAVRLLQGDLAEAWREASDEYATVAMRFSLIDVEIERQSGQLIKGNPDSSVESTELWTFRRPPGSGSNAWKLSAVQQT